MSPRCLERDASVLFPAEEMPNSGSSNALGGFRMCISEFFPHSVLSLGPAVEFVRVGDREKALGSRERNDSYRPGPRVSLIVGGSGSFSPRSGTG